MRKGVNNDVLKNSKRLEQTNNNAHVDAKSREADPHRRLDYRAGGANC